MLYIISMIYLWLVSSATYTLAFQIISLQLLAYNTVMQTNSPSLNAELQSIHFLNPVKYRQPDKHFYIFYYAIQCN